MRQPFQDLSLLLMFNLIPRESLLSHQMTNQRAWYQHFLKLCVHMLLYYLLITLVSMHDLVFYQHCSQERVTNPFIFVSFNSSIYFLYQTLAFSLTLKLMQDVDFSFPLFLKKKVKMSHHQQTVKSGNRHGSGKPVEPSNSRDSLFCDGTGVVDCSLLFISQLRP